MTYYEHRRQSDRAYFEPLIEVWGIKKAIRLSGLHKATFYRKTKALRLPVRYRGNGAWQSLDDTPR